MQNDQLIDHEGAYETTEEKDPSEKEKTNILRQHRLSQEVAALIADTGDEDDSSSRADLDRDSDELALLEQ